MKKKGFMKRGQIRAQANIITVVLIILLVIVALVIVWNVVQPLIKRTSEQIGTAAFTTSLEIEEAKLWVTGGAKVRVKRGSGEGEITSLKFIFYTEDGESVIIERDDKIPNELETKIYEFGADEINEKIVSVSVVPMFGKAAGIEIVEDEPSKNAVEEDSGLVSWWKFDGDVDDSVGENDGSLEGNAKIENNELVLDGDGDYVSFGSNTSLFPSSSITIEAWLNLNALPSGVADITQHIAGGASKVFIRTSPTNKVTFSVVATGGGRGTTSTTTLAVDQWYHLVGTYDGSVVKLYVNGIPEDTSSPTSGDIDWGALGAFRVSGATGGTSAQINGQIDNVMLFNKALSEDEIKAIYNNQKK